MGIDIRGARPEERPAAQHLIDLAHDAESHGPSLAHPCASVGSSHLDPHDRAENTRLLLADGQMVSVMHVLERQAYAGEARAGFGIITDVATHPDHRRRGYMRMLLADAERHMRERGLCYAVLFGRFAWYGGLGWRWCGERRRTLNTAWVVPATSRPTGAAAAEATDDDAPFLAEVYEARYRACFGPVVRSHDYWLRWSLQRPRDGRYIVVCEGGRRVGYFHFGNGVDEVGWVPGDLQTAEDVLRAASAWGAAAGQREVLLFLQESDQEALAALRRACDARQVSVDAMGQPASDADPARMLARLWEQGSGLMVKWLREGPGALTGVDSTEALTEAMARQEWTVFDGDMA